MIYLYSNTVVVFDTATAAGAAAAAAVIVGVVVVDFSFRRFEKDRERTRKRKSEREKKTTTSEIFFFFERTSEKKTEVASVCLFLLTIDDEYFRLFVMLHKYTHRTKYIPNAYNNDYDNDVVSTNRRCCCFLCRYFYHIFRKS